MFSHIMIPVDLAHRERLEKALDVGGALAKLYGARVTYVGATTEAPSDVAHTPKEFDAKLLEFARAEGERLGVETSARGYATHDPSTDLDRTLLSAVDEVGADLVVMASHPPGVADWIWPSHGGRLATHSKAAVFLVR